MMFIDLITELKIRGEMTPDFPSFKRKEYVLLFVYDDFKSGTCPRNYLKKHGKNLGRARSHLDTYVLKYFDKGEYPILFSDNLPTSVKRGYIWGEVWAVPPEVILIFDQIYQNGVFYKRINKSFLLTEQDEVLKSKAKPFCQAFVYLGNEVRWNDDHLVIDFGSTSLNNTGQKRLRFYEHKDKRNSRYGSDLFNDYHGYGHNSYHGSMYGS